MDVHTFKKWRLLAYTVARWQCIQDLHCLCAKKDADSLTEIRLVPSRLNLVIKKQCASQISPFQVSSIFER